jgi:DNA-binding CsgD family transcriptional regulator
MRSHLSVLPDSLVSDLCATVGEPALQAAPTKDQHMRGQLDRMRCGIVFCDIDARVHWLNRSAERLLADGPLHLVGSRLRADSDAQTAELMSELAEPTVGNTARYLRLGQGERALHLAIQVCVHPSTMVLTLTSPSRSTNIPTDALMRLFGLTPTEALLVAALAAGNTVEQYAQQRGVSVGTARVQLKKIQRKTGAQRQSDLVRIVWSSAAAHLSLGCADPAGPSMHLDPA